MFFKKWQIISKIVPVINQDNYIRNQINESLRYNGGKLGATLLNKRVKAASLPGSLYHSDQRFTNKAETM
jgi:hypothetical protein